MATDMEIDDSLYSRQRYVLGDSAMKQMASSSILIHGMGGLGVEIAKNIALAGVKSLTVQDGKAACWIDLGTQFFLREDDVKNERNRAEVSARKLAELNPYVAIETLTSSITHDTDLSYLTNYQCVIITDLPMSLQIKINQFCRAQQQQIKFIGSDVFGVCARAFVDFGDSFEVLDVTGEECKEILIEKITKSNPGVVTCMKLHGFETGDHVTFREVNGMSRLNGMTCQIKVTSPQAFEICDTSGDTFLPYEHGGIVSQIQVPHKFTFQPLEVQLKNPSLLMPDLSKFEAPLNLHLGFLAVEKFLEENGQFPEVWSNEDAKKVLVCAQRINEQLETKVESVDEKLIQTLSSTSRGCFAPLCAAIGGFVAQEGLKAVSGKFTPLNQWLYLDCKEVITETPGVTAKNDRYDALRICVGEKKLDKLAKTRLFMVGCGAIGCEMLKNYALMGIGSSGGLITITDNDLIEKSNLNRQFLFRPQHIRQPKSTTAAQSAREINPELKIEAHQHKVCPQTEDTVYNDAFFESQDLIVNALDNVEARRYVDSRCVTNQRPLLESGTMGTKGHVQVIVPHMTESYGSQRDPVDDDVPYCTLKSFPANVEHCIQWGREKFESSFAIKPNLFNKFWKDNPSPATVAEKLIKGNAVENAVQVSKILQNRCTEWKDCVALARLKFQKYFNHKARNLLHHFPLDTRLADGSLFWQSPKRPPVPQDFDPENPIHMLFVVSTARVYADQFKIPQDVQVTSEDYIKQVLSEVKVPTYKPTNKRIVTDESEKGPDKEETVYGTGDEVLDAGNRIQIALKSSGNSQLLLSPLNEAEFEKDDDSNAHIDFITAAANLRAMMYNIATVDRLKVKRIAGRIVPAIATTTAAVSGLVSVEISKVLDRLPIEAYKNCFLNLAIPVMILSEPGPCQRNALKEGLSVTMWDKWEVKGHKDYTLQEFLQYFKTTYGFEATMVAHGVKMIYVPFMPPHKKRLPQAMMKLIKPTDGQKYVDLVVCLQGDNQEDVEGPPVRYFFGV